MPRFHFNVYDGRDDLDPEGTELPSSAAAQLEAIRVAGAIVRDDAARLAACDDWHLDVTDASGLVLMRIDVLITTAPVGMKLPAPMHERP